jgi:transcriptional regulator with XRE-family HTH domain
MEKQIKGHMSISRVAATTAPLPAVPSVKRVDSLHVERSQEFSRLGRYVWQRMGELGMRKQLDLVHEPGLSKSTVSRILRDDDFRPHVDTLRVLAERLDVDANELILFVHGEAEPAAAGAPIHPRAAELNRMLAADSGLPPAEREQLDALTDRVMALYRQHMRSPRRSA